MIEQILSHSSVHRQKRVWSRRFLTGTLTGTMAVEVGGIEAFTLLAPNSSSACREKV
jgi:hypothetical protein